MKGTLPVPAKQRCHTEEDGVTPDAAGQESARGAAWFACVGKMGICVLYVSRMITRFCKPNNCIDFILVYVYKSLQNNV